MTEGYEEDLEMYEEAGEAAKTELDNDVLLQKISYLPYPKEPFCVAPDAKVGTALETMTEKKVGALLVVNNGKVVGIFGERDVLKKKLYTGDQLDRPVSEFMTAEPICLTSHDSIGFALNRMVIGGFRHVPLVDSDGNLDGILGMRDVVRHIVSFFPAEVVNLPPHSEHSPPDFERDGG